MTKLYEEWIDPKTALQARYRARGVEYYARLSKEIEMVIRSLSKKGSGLDVFDFGMGWGNWCLMAKAYGCTPFGAELSQSRIEHAQELGIKVVSWDDIPNHQFDFINTEQVFEHIATPLDTLRHLSKALKPKGMIKISVPNGRDIKRKLAIFDWTAGKGEKDSLNPVAPLEHINCFSYQSIARMAHIVGLEEVDVRSRSRKNQHLSELTLRDLVYPAYRWLLRAKYGHGAGLTYLFFQSR